MKKTLTFLLMVFACYSQDNVNRHNSLFISASAGIVNGKSKTNLFYDPSGRITTAVEGIPKVCFEALFGYSLNRSAINAGLGLKFFSEGTNFKYTESGLFSGPVDKNVDLNISILEAPEILLHFDPFYSLKILFHPYLELGGAAAFVTKATMDGDIKNWIGNTTVTVKSDVTDELRKCFYLQNIGFGIKMSPKKFNLAFGFSYEWSFTSLAKRSLPESSSLRQVVANRENPDYNLKLWVTHFKYIYYFRI